MSSKLLYSLSDENKDLQKQIGCMNGFFQLFHRQHFLFTRRIKNDAIKRLPSGQTCNKGNETYHAFRTIVEDSHEIVREKQRNSTESSRTSVSSSWSSSFSSLECNKTNQLEQPLYSPANIPETRSQNIRVNQPSPSHSRRHSFDLQDVVRDNIHKGSQGLSVKTATNEKVVNHKFKHADSPRPVQRLRSPKPKASSVTGSPQLPAKLGEAPCRFIENRSGSLPLKDARRLSYDGRELRDSSKSSMKLKEVPRLSLDSRRGLIRESNSTIRLSNSLADLQRGTQNKYHIHQNEPESSRGPSSVVAKLMGLEAFPTVAPSTESRTAPNTNFQEHDPLSKSSKSVNEKGQNKTPKTSMEAISPKFQKLGSVVKSRRSSKIPIEPAPWRQQSESKGPSTATLKNQESPKNSNSFPSVYGEIEKRLAELEFRKSGRDLRALKQILEAMQKTKERLESTKEIKESYTSDPVSQTSNKSSVSQNFDLESPRSMQCDSRISATVKGVCPLKNFKSRILIMKPSEHVEGNCSASSRSLTDSPSRLRSLWASDSVSSRRELVGKQTKDMNQRKIHVDSSAWSPTCNDRSPEAFAKSKVPQNTEADSYTSLSRSSGSVSPRPGQKKNALEKHSHSTIGSANSTTPGSIGQCSKQSTETVSPRRKLKSRIPSLQHNVVNTKVSNNMRDDGGQGSMSSQHFSNTTISASHIEEAKATSTDGSNKVTYSLFKPAIDIQTILVDMSREEKPVEGPMIVTLDQPSPVSVLDTAFYREEPPSPIKKISSTFRDDQQMDTDESEQNMGNLNHATEISRNVDYSSHATEISQNNIQNLQNLVRDIRQTNLTHETPTLLFEETNPNHIYILEVLLASGLLTGADSDVSAVQLHTSGYLLDPKLFVQLEKTKAGTWSSDVHKAYKRSNHDEKIHRQLTFDAVNEILLRKLVVEGSLKPPQGSTNRLAKRKLTEDQLYRDICNEIDHLEINNRCYIVDEEDYLKGIMLQDIKTESMSWTDCEQELSGVVLDVERLIFKDLINEVVSADISDLSISAGRHCRQLFR